MLRLQQLNSEWKIFVYNQMVNPNAVGIKKIDYPTFIILNSLFAKIVHRSNFIWELKSLCKSLIRKRES